MERLSPPPRADWRARVETLGFDFHTIDSAPYWDESHCWRFSADEVDVIEDAADELHRLCLDAVEHAVAKGLLPRLGISGVAAELVERSWRDREPCCYGRFDLAWDGTGAPKLLEYNADTPTSLFEAAVIQWQWLEDVAPRADQFNSLHEALVERWRSLGAGAPTDLALHLTSAVPHPEDEGTVRYLQATAMEAGLATKFLAIADIGWNGAGFVDLDGDPIRWLFKLYPWEWLAAEPFAAHIGASGLAVLEPAWKLALAGKGILALLWELFPGHPNLLPAGFERNAVPAGRVVRKPLFGREGSNVVIFEGETELAAAEGPYGDGGWVWQAWTPLAMAGDGAAVVGAWMVGDKCHGMGIREDTSLITRDTSRFVPHFFELR